MRCNPLCGVHPPPETKIWVTPPPCEAGGGVPPGVAAKPPKKIFHPPVATAPTAPAKNFFLGGPKGRQKNFFGQNHPGVTPFLGHFLLFFGKITPGWRRRRKIFSKIHPRVHP